MTIFREKGSGLLFTIQHVPRVAEPDRYLATRYPRGIFPETKLVQSLEDFTVVGRR